MFQKLIAWIWDLHGMNCQQAVRLASRSLDEKLPFREGFQLRFHFFLCKYCDHYYRHLVKIREWLGESKASGNISAEEHLSDDARKRIAKALSGK